MGGQEDWTTWASTHTTGIFQPAPEGTSFPVASSGAAFQFTSAVGLRQTQHRLTPAALVDHANLFSDSTQTMGERKTTQLVSLAFAAVPSL